jgi:hypothetical protein
MVMMYFDRDSDVDHRFKREQGFDARMPALRLAMQESVRANDPTFQAAFRHWFADVVRRISSRRPQTMKVPRELQLARGLDTQEVALSDKGAISGTIDGKVCLLYPIHHTVS